MRIKATADKPYFATVLIDRQAIRDFYKIRPFFHTHWVFPSKI